MLMDLSRLFTVVLAILALPTSGVAQLTGAGFLDVSPATPGICGPDPSVLFSGQAVRLIGSGFSPGATVEIYFSEQDGPTSLIASAVTDEDGALDTTTTLPVVLSTPVIAGLEALGDTTAGGKLSLGALFELHGSPGTNSDTDLIPDLCDNCPQDANQGQEDSDSDGIGDVCDACPADHDNDADGDGQCGNVDPCPFDSMNDSDGDGLCAEEDNCPTQANPDQADLDQNGIGDACQTAETCADGLDNDGDGAVDFPDDAGCSDSNDTTETGPTRPCDDGIDNDSDSLTDRRDPGCGIDTTLAENPECDDGIDDDGDGKVDWDGDFGLHPAEIRAVAMAP